MRGRDREREGERESERERDGTLPFKLESVFVQGDNSYPFDQVVFCNIGDCHAMGQRPLTFVRQLLSACTNPTQLLDDTNYPTDVIERAKEILQNCPGNSIGKPCTRVSKVYMYVRVGYRMRSCAYL